MFSFPRSSASSAAERATAARFAVCASALAREAAFDRAKRRKSPGKESCCFVRRRSPLSCVAPVAGAKVIAAISAAERTWLGGATPPSRYSMLSPSLWNMAMFFTARPVCVALPAGRPAAAQA